MYAMKMYGKAIIREDNDVPIPSPNELSSRYKKDPYSQMFLEGRKSNKVSPVYKNSSDVMQRRK